MAAVQHCPTCSCGPDLPEPLYSLDTASLLAPATVPAIKRWMSRHPEQFTPPVYRILRSAHGRYVTRMVRVADLHALRAHFTTNQSKVPRHAAQATPPAHAAGT